MKGENEKLLVPNSLANMDVPLDEKTSDDMLDTVTIKRRVYTQNKLDRTYHKAPTPKSIKDRFRKKCQCSKSSILRGFISLLPVLLVIKRYNWRQNLLGDFMAGLSVSFMHFPQGIGFGILASLRAVHGLYSTFFAIAFYAIFGTSQHVSFGTNAVIALLTASIVDRESDLMFGGDGNSSNVTESGEDIENTILQYKVGVAMAVTFLTGLFLLAMGVFRLGFITNYLAVSFVGGFTTAASFHITTSQVSKLFGLSIKSKPGAGKIVLMYVDIFSNLGSTNIADFVIGMISIAILLGVKVGINERYGKKLKMPIPIDLIIVIIATIISHFAEFNRRFGMHVVGFIPSGMPVPSLPDLTVTTRIAQDSFVIAILVFAMTISMAKLCAALHDYEVDSNQELVAYGATNILSSFFQCFPTCVAPPRSMILSSLGSKTTLNAIPAAIFILVVLLVAGQLFVSLPIAVLAAMIMVAMKNLLLQVKQLPVLWKISKADFIIWLTTALVSILVDLDIGLIAGIGVSIFSIIVQSQFSSGQLVGISEKEDVYLDIKYHKDIKELKGIKIFYFSTTLFFASAERFKSQLFQKTYHPLKYEKNRKTFVVEADGLKDRNSAKDSQKENGNNTAIEIETENPIHHIIIDCSAMTYIDMAGVNVLKLVITQFQRVGTEIFLANCCRYMLSVLEKSQIYDILPKNHVFYDVHDAVTEACMGQKITLKL